MSSVFKDFLLFFRFNTFFLYYRQIIYKLETISKFRCWCVNKRREKLFSRYENSFFFFCFFFIIISFIPSFFIKTNRKFDDAFVFFHFKLCIYSNLILKLLDDCNSHKNFTENNVLMIVKRTKMIKKQKNFRYLWLLVWVLVTFIYWISNSVFKNYALFG